VPRSSHLTKRSKGGFLDSLLQVDNNGQSVVFNLDSPSHEEVITKIYSEWPVEDPSQFLYNGLYDPRTDEASNLLITKDGLYKVSHLYELKQIYESISTEGETMIERETILMTLDNGRAVLSLLTE